MQPAGRVIQGLMGGLVNLDLRVCLVLLAGLAYQVLLDALAPKVSLA